jgi:hypothetical protein
VKRFFLLTLSILAFAILVSGQQAEAQLDQYGRWENGVSEAWWFDDSLSKPEIEIVKARWRAIQNEFSHSNDGFAGEYFEGGETHGTYFRWAPKNGFVRVDVDKCAARVMGFSYGDALPDRPFLTLVTKGSGSSQGAHSHHKPAMNRFALVTWRSIPYLMVEQDIQAFCEYVAGLGKFNTGLHGHFDLWPFPFYTGRGTETGTADELPIVPAGYEHLVRRSIDASISAVGARTVRKFRVDYDDAPHYESRIHVTIDAGRNQGVRLGMKFVVLDSTEDDELVITSVGMKRSTGVMVRFVEETPQTHFSQWKDYDRYSPVKAGWKVSTSIHKLPGRQN